MNAIAKRWMQSVKPIAWFIHLLWGTTFAVHHFSICDVLQHFQASSGTWQFPLPTATRIDSKNDHNEIILKCLNGKVAELQIAGSHAESETKLHSFLGGLLNHYERVAA